MMGSLRRLSREQKLVLLQERLDARFGNDVVAVKAESFVDLSTPCTFVDHRHGEFRALPGNALNGYGHPNEWKLRHKGVRQIRPAEIAERVAAASEGKVQIVGEYAGMLHKCLFRDSEFGEFVALPANVIHHHTRHPLAAPGRRREAFRKRFGVDHHMQNDEQFLKQISARPDAIKIKHWETAETLICLGQFEAATVRWLNRRRVRFYWQKKAFTMPNGHTYRPDIYLPDRMVWVEIKGRQTATAMEKWAWFRTIEPTAELWDQARLEEIGALPMARRRNAARKQRAYNAA